MADLFTDIFDGSDDPLGTSASDWETLSDHGLKEASGYAFSSTNSQATGGTAFQYLNLHVSGVPVAHTSFAVDQYAQITLNAYTNTDYHGVMVRATGGSEATLNGYLVVAEYSGLRLWEVTNGVVTSLGYNARAHVGTDVVYVEIQNYDLIVKINGTPVITVTDGSSTHATGQPAIAYSWGDSHGTHIDSFGAGIISTTTPTWNNPDPESDKIGAVVSVDVVAAGWFTSSLGPLVFDTITTGVDVGELPAGLSMDAAGLITGTLTELADASFDCVITVNDDNGELTAQAFTWEITDYSLVLSGTTKLLNTSNSPYNPATTVNFSAIKGTIDEQNLGGTVEHWAAHAVTDGVPDTPLTSATLTSGTWTVFAQDVSALTILAVYEIVAE